MAETQKEKRVEIYVPRAAANEDPNLFVSVNGVNYILPKGKTSLVPPHVKAEIERGRKAETAADERSAKLAAK